MAILQPAVGGAALPLQAGGRACHLATVPQQAPAGGPGHLHKRPLTITYIHVYVVFTEVAVGVGEGPCVAGETGRSVLCTKQSSVPCCSPAGAASALGAHALLRSPLDAPRQRGQRRPWGWAQVATGMRGACTQEPNTVFPCSTGSKYAVPAVH